jgi:hypothetical protein
MTIEWSRIIVLKPPIFDARPKISKTPIEKPVGLALKKLLWIVPAVVALLAIADTVPDLARGGETHTAWRHAEDVHPDLRAAWDDLP